MLRVLNQTDIKPFNKVRNEFPYSRILMRIDSLDDCEGQLMAVSDSTDSDDDLCEKLHECLKEDILCVIIGSYMQGGNNDMPTLSLFYGIIIRMYSEPNGRHKMPYIHAEYQSEKAVFGLDGELIEGEFPKKQRKMVEAWIAIHEDDLKANWQLLMEGQQYFKIPPLQ